VNGGGCPWSFVLVTGCEPRHGALGDLEEERSPGRNKVMCRGNTSVIQNHLTDQGLEGDGLCGSREIFRKGELAREIEEERQGGIGRG
jgi:hypothetical protein